MSAVTIIQGDAMEQLRKLPAESVHACCTSPPYWGLRDYSIPPRVWGGVEGCIHDFKGVLKRHRGGAQGKTGQRATRDTAAADAVCDINCGQFCICGAWLGVLGLEPTPELFVEHLVMVFDEVRRVLRKDGTCWVNLGDSYAGGGNGGGGSFAQDGIRMGCHGGGDKNVPFRKGSRGVGGALKAGDMVGAPWRFALAMQAAGWWLRRDVIWHKPGPMPESVNGWRWEKCRVKSGNRIAADWKALPKGWDVGQGSHDKIPDGNYRKNGEREATTAEIIDCPGCKKCAPNGGLVLRRANWRPTTAHEYIFQFAKSDNYFCDAEAARERTTCGAHTRGLGVNPKAKKPGKNSRVNKDVDLQHGTQMKQNPSFSAAVVSLVSSRNLRSVWRIPTSPYRGAHCATFPPALIRPIILAATSPQCCASCGAPWAPVVERGEPDLAHQRACGGDANGNYNGHATKDFFANGAQDASATKARILAGMVKKKVTHYLAICRCGPKAGSVPAIVLDPFAGAFTTCMVSRDLGRNSIGIELSPDYCEQGRKRTNTTAGIALA